MLWFTVAIFALLSNVLLQAADVWTTVQALQLGASEGNAVARGMMERYGIHAWIQLKAAIMAALLMMVPFVRPYDLRSQRQIAIPSMALFGWMAFVVVNNVVVLVSI